VWTQTWYITYSTFPYAETSSTARRRAVNHEWASGPVLVLAGEAVESLETPEAAICEGPLGDALRSYLPL